MIRWKIAFVALLGSIGLASLLSGQTPRVAQVVAVRAGRLFDSKSGQMLANQVIVIQGERISDVGTADQVKIPAGAQVIDLGQASVMPGFVDGHTHVYDSLAAGGRVNTSVEAWTILAVKEAETDLRAGFTTVRDLGTHGEGYGDVAVRDAINKGLFDGPRDSSWSATCSCAYGGIGFLNLNDDGCFSLGIDISNPGRSAARTNPWLTRYSA